MRLVDRNPQWMRTSGGREGVGLLFDCPCASCVSSDNPMPIGVAFDRPLDLGDSLTGAGPLWHRTGDTFETLTLTPSILMHVGTTEHWHGYLTNGDLNGC